MGNGVLIQSLSFGSFNTVLNNRIGVSATVQALGNGGDGVHFLAEDNCTITGNIIGANGGDGIDIEGYDDGLSTTQSAPNNAVYGNFIGTNAQNSALGNAGNGIRLGLRTSQTTIGQSGASGSNVIGFNGGSGIALVGTVPGPVTFTTIRNNFIGVAANGSTAMPNQGGISVQNATSTFIGGVGSSDGNVISGNAGNGIQFLNSNFADIKGNFIGVDASGSFAVPNGGNGISSNGSPDLVIGGTNGRNIIAGNGGNGISFLSTNNSFVQGNSIGTDASGNLVLGNGGNGIDVQGTNNSIGGAGIGQGNLIAFNGGIGVTVSAGSSGNAIRSNAIFGSGALGIDEGAVGVTANDAGDSDGVQNYPVITSAKTLGTGTRIIGSLNSVAGTDFDLDFFSSSAADPTGFGEGQTPLISQSVTTDNVGNATFNFTVPAVPIGSFITATATRRISPLNSSEFSQSVAVVTPTFSLNDVSIAEGDSGTSNAVFTVTLTPPNTGTITSTVNFATSNGTATAPSDYTSTSGTLTFAPGVATQTISVPIIGDTTIEADETFTVNLSGATNAVIGRATGTGTIVNDDSPAISINSGSVNEGDSGTTNGSFTVTLSQPSALTVTVDYATADGSATAPADYTSTAGTLTFAPGVTSRPLTIPVIGDTVIEPDENFAVNLSKPINATISQAQGTGTIVNDDFAGLSINDVTIDEGDSGTSNATFTVTLSPSNRQTSTVDFATSDGSATAPSDYTSTSGTLTFAPGVATQTIAVPIIGDRSVEANENFAVTLSNPLNATIGRARGVGTIRNDDTAIAPTLALSIAPATISENGPASTCTVTRSGNTSAALVVQIANDNPERVSTPLSVTIPTGSASATFAATPIDNAIADGGATAAITVSATGFSSDSADLVVQDDDTPTLTLTITPDTFSEATGPRAARGVVTRNTATSTPLTVTLDTNNPNKVRLPDTVTIVAGSDNVAFVVGAVDNQLSDGDTTVLVRASAPNFASSTQSVVVTDNDGPPADGGSVVSNTS